MNVYPDGMSGKERMDYMKKKSNEYYNLRDKWREMLKNGNASTVHVTFFSFILNILLHYSSEKYNFFFLDGW